MGQAPGKSMKLKTSGSLDPSRTLVKEGITERSSKTLIGGSRQSHSREQPFPVPIYCINLESSTHRKERMVKRFELAGLTKNVTFINAISKDAPIVEYYTKGALCWYGGNVDLWRRDAAVYSSHLKAIRTFLENPHATSCIICEDDILFRNDFQTQFQALINNLPSDAPLLSLTWMVSGPIDQRPVGRDYSQNNLWRIDPEFTWGAQCYYITREYALQVITAFDCPWDGLIKDLCIDKVASEIIIRMSKGYMASNPIVIEDCIDSDRSPQDTPYHIRHFCKHGYEKFCLSDPDGLSPLKNTTPSDSWSDYPFRRSL